MRFVTTWSCLTIVCMLLEMHQVILRSSASSVTFVILTAQPLLPLRAAQGLRCLLKGCFACAGGVVLLCYTSQRNRFYCCCKGHHGRCASQHLAPAAEPSCVVLQCRQGTQLPPSCSAAFLITLTLGKLLGTLLACHLLALDPCT